MGKWRSHLIAVTFLTVLSLPSKGYAQGTEVTLDLIAKTADRICWVVTMAGSTTSTKDAVKVELNGLASQLANAGAQGSGAITTDAFLRDQLATALRHTTQAECRLHVFQVLADKLVLDDTAPPTTGPTRAPPLPGPTYQPSSGQTSPAGSGDGRRILDTGYDRLSALGGEAPGYGLYSYVLIPAASKSSIALIREIFRVFPAVKETGAARSQINILYLPFRKQKQAVFKKKSETDQQRAETYLNSFYDFQLARRILNHLCNPPAPTIRDVCNGDRSIGPFIFTYAAPASKTEPVDPPYLLVDLRDVHERAVGEFVAAYQEQIKSKDFSDRARLDTLRLKILNITLKASYWTPNVSKNLTDIVHFVLPGSPGGEK
jgi:hypothetical protein